MAQLHRFPETIRGLTFGRGGPGLFAGKGSPEGVVSAVVGSAYQRWDGGAGTSLYVKETGTGSTGWVAYTHGGGGGSGTVTSVATGTGLSGGTITTTGTLVLADTAVTPGSYTSVDLTVDQQGRITAAASGASSGTIQRLSLGSPAASDPVGIHAAITLTGATQTVTTGITPPDGTYGRTLSITTAFPGDDGAGGTVTVHGTASDGSVISEDFAFTDVTGELKHGSKAFKSVTSIVVPSKDTAAAGTISVGVSGGIGIGFALTTMTVISAQQPGTFDSNHFASAFDLAGTPGLKIDGSAVEGNLIFFFTPDGTEILVDYYVI